MSDSPLVSGTLLTDNRNSPRSHAIDTITPHYMAWYTDARTCCQSFVPTSRKASANYCIGKDGEIWLNVHESDRAWTSSSAANDNRAVTIECANYTDDARRGVLPDETWASLVALCADICKRNGKTRLVYRGSADYSGLAATDMLLTMHKWFAATDCPGPWLSTQFDRLAAEVNKALGNTAGGDAQGGDEMVCIIQPNGEGYLEYFDGTKVHPLSHPDEVEALNMVYKATHGGASIPCFALGTKNTPWAARLHGALR